MTSLPLTIIYIHPHTHTPLYIQTSPQVTGFARYSIKSNNDDGDKDNDDDIDDANSYDDVDDDDARGGGGKKELFYLTKH